MMVTVMPNVEISAGRRPTPSQGDPSSGSCIMQSSISDTVSKRLNNENEASEYQCKVNTWREVPSGIKSTEDSSRFRKENVGCQLGRTTELLAELQ
jgi:hypothetical protein